MKGHLFKDLFNTGAQVKALRIVVKGHLFKDLFNQAICGNPIPTVVKGHLFKDLFNCRSERISQQML